RLGLLHELVPQAATIGFLVNSNFSLAHSQLKDAEMAARALGLKLDVLRANTNRDIDAAFETIVQRHIRALATAAGPFFDTRREQLVALAARHGVPTMYHLREYVVAGGLASYGIDLPDAYRQVGVYAARILKGAKPGDLPVMQPTKFELVLNVKTAKKLGLNIPRDLFARADELVE